MHKCISMLTDYCVQHSLVERSNADWLRYGLEKRLSTIVVAIPFFILAVLLTNFQTACAFYFAFFFLRKQTNGYHARTVRECLAISLVLEVALCICVNPLLNTSVRQILIACICTYVVFRYAPLIHPNLPLTPTEIHVLRRKSRMRICLLSALILLSQLLHFTGIANGLTLGITLASIMLCISHIDRKVRFIWKSTLKK